MKSTIPVPSITPRLAPCRSIIPRIHSNLIRCLHTTPAIAATPLPITATGPPPAAPVPKASQYGERIDRRRRQAEILKRGQESRAAFPKPGTTMKKRFWKDVSVQTDDEGNHIVNLDNRTVRNPTTKTPLHIPSTKPHLANALALEWDLLVSAQQATRSHLIPITSLASRAQTLALEDAQDQHAPSANNGVRYEVVNTLLRYLDTDTLLCWAPSSSSPIEQETNGERESLRDLQIRIAKPILSYLTQVVWPGVYLNPTLDDGSILPKSQPAATRAVIKGWMAGLPAWELVGLERAVLASKSLCVAARLVCEWSEHLKLDARNVVGESSRQEGEIRRERFGIEEAAEACSAEVRWQTRQWGEVEDTHDVEKEDLKRQLGSVILLVNGTGTTSIT
ncbi:ATP synthase mitochondrial F1 complex assembly factor 2 [Lecanora helva]